jgi:hypothetical protein
MRPIDELVIDYRAAWNETDDRRRRELVARTWTDDDAAPRPSEAALFPRRSS